MRIEEAHVQLQHVHRHVFQRVQRRVSAAEVVHLHGEAGAAQFHDGSNQLVRRFHVRAFGDLEVQQAGRHIVALHEPLEIRAQVGSIDVGARQVHRQMRHGVATVRVDPRAQAAARLIPHIVIEAGDEAVALEHGNELGGTQQTTLGMLPAREHFGADHTAGRIAVLRLEERHELPPVERGSHLARQLLLLQQRRTQRLVVQHIAAARRTALRGAQRQERTVAHEVDVQLGIVDGIHPHANEEGEVLTIGSEPVVEHGEHAIGVEQRTREAADEMIGAQPSRRRIARQIAADHLADISEQAIARRSAEQIVIRLEAIDVAVHKNIRLIGMGVDQCAHAHVESAAV